MNARQLRRQIVRTAATRIRSAAVRIEHAAASDTAAEGRWLAGYEAAELFRAALDAAERLALVVNDDDVDEVLERTLSVAKYLRGRRLASKLDQVDGRTPEEAAAFRRKAEELRS